LRAGCFTPFTHLNFEREIAMMRDLKDNIDVVPTIAPLSAVRATGTTNGTSVDLQGYDAAVAVFNAGAWTDGQHTPALFDSPDNATFTAVPAANLQGSFTPVISAAGQNAVQRVGYVGPNRYLRGQLVGAGITTGMPSDMTIIRGSPRVKPLP
jgi:hypothetical protein